MTICLYRWSQSYSTSYRHYQPRRRYPLRISVVAQTGSTSIMDWLMLPIPSADQQPFASMRFVTYAWTHQGRRFGGRQFGLLFRRFRGKPRDPRKTAGTSLSSMAKLSVCNHPAHSCRIRQSVEEDVLVPLYGSAQTVIITGLPSCSDP